MPRAATVPALYEQRRLYASLFGWSVALVLARYWVVWLAERAVPESQGLWWYTPLAPAQDLCVVGLVWLMATRLHRRIGSARWRRAFRLTVWLLMVAGLLYAAVNVELYRFVRSPLTYRLWALSDRLKGVRASLDAAVDLERCLTLAVLPAVGALAAAAGSSALRRWPRLLHWLARAPYAAVAYGAVGTAVLLGFCPERTAFANPYTALVISLVARDDPFIAGTPDARFMAEFDPARRNRIEGQSEAVFSPGVLAGHNVVLLVLESVGAKYCSLYDAPWPTTPTLERLAARYGVVFQRAYAHAPWTSSAMASLFCSLLPRHGWRAIPGKYPRLAVPSLADVCRRAGYRTGILHTGDLSFDDEDRFLQNHGFDTVWDYRVLRTVTGLTGRQATKGGKWQLPDHALLDAMRIWLADRPGQPFLLVLWTIQPHHPYVPVGPIRFRTGDKELDRYLTAVAENDELVGRLWGLLGEMGLDGRTLFVVTGDHGEAFRQHGHIAHGQTLFEEEVRVPLVFLHGNFRPRRVPATARQIDLAPTIASVLGLDPAPEWQGRPLRSRSSPPVYLFTSYNHYLFGLVMNRKKYVLDATTGDLVAYDLARDPQEQSPHALSQQRADEVRRRLASWLAFQNAFLESHRHAANSGRKR